MKIGNLEIKVPIFQGGMGIRVSMSKLAAAVINEGGVGVISGTAIPIEELIEEIRKTKKMIVKKGGALGVNVMVATSNFFDVVKTCIREKVDIIICGAGFSRDVFEMVKDSGVKLIPIVSSLKLAKISEKLGADAIVVEGGNAGGHLGTLEDSWDIVEDIAKNIKIPVIGAGGVITPNDAKKMMKLGVDGIQMGSRFVATEECGASKEFKEMYLNAKKEDLVQIMSSVGLPANAIVSPYVRKILDGKETPTKRCTQCLKKCKKNFCIKERLINSFDGDIENGIVFAGKDAWKINEILTVKEIFKRFGTIFKN